MLSPVYWHPLLYKTAMRISYGRHYSERYTALEKHIPSNAHVLELCMGDAFLYHNHLRQKNVRYSCADINPVFVKAAKRRGIDAQRIDLFKDEIPKSDYVLVQGSLYHFIDNPYFILKKLLDATNKKLIISEPVDNLSNSSSSLKASLGAFLSNAGSGQSRIKYTRQSIRETFHSLDYCIETWEELPENREVIIVLKKN